MIHLVTGRKGEAHITSADIRSQNRSVYGKGVYRLPDQNVCSTITTASSRIVVTAGSYMWYGMHIRITENYEIPVSFSGTQNWRVMFNYSKTASGNDYVENVTLTADNSSAVPTGFTSDEDTSASIVIARLTTSNGTISGDVRYEAMIMNTLADTSDYDILFDEWDGWKIGYPLNDDRIWDYQKLILRVSNGCVGEMTQIARMPTGGDTSDNTHFRYREDSFYFRYPIQDTSYEINVVCLGKIPTAVPAISICKLREIRGATDARPKLYLSGIGVTLIESSGTTFNYYNTAQIDGLHITSLLGVGRITHPYPEAISEQ